MAMFNLFGRVSGFVRYFLLVKFLTTADYGLVAFSFYMGSLCRHFTDGGLDIFISRDGARDYKKVPAFYVNAMVMKVCFALVFCGIAFWYLSTVSEKSWREMGLIYIALFGSIMTSFTGVVRSCFTAIERMEFVFYTNLPSRLISITLLFVVLWFALPLEWVVACVSLENAIWFILLGTISLRFFTLRLNALSLPLMGTLFWEALPLFAYNFFNILYLSLDVIMIDYFMGEEAVAPYAYASLLMEGVILLVSSYFVAVYPTLSRLYISDMDAYRKLFRQSFIMLLMFTIPASVALGFWSDLWMNLIKDTGVISGKVLSVLAVNLNISMLNTLLFIVFTSCNRQRMLVLFLTLAVAVSLGSNWYLIPLYGQQGAAWATLLSMLFLLIILAPVAVRLFSLSFPWQKPLWLLSLSVLSALLTQWIPGLPVLIEPVVFSVLLTGLGWITGIISKDEWQKIMSAFRPKKVS